MNGNEDKAKSRELMQVETFLHADAKPSLLDTLWAPHERELARWGWGKEQARETFPPVTTPEPHFT